MHFSLCNLKTKNASVIFEAKLCTQISFSAVFIYFFNHIILDEQAKMLTAIIYLLRDLRIKDIKKKDIWWQLLLLNAFQVCINPCFSANYIVLMNTDFPSNYISLCIIF